MGGETNTGLPSLTVRMILFQSRRNGLSTAVNCARKRTMRSPLSSALARRPRTPQPITAARMAQGCVYMMYRSIARINQFGKGIQHQDGCDGQCANHYFHPVNTPGNTLFVKDSLSIRWTPYAIMLFPWAYGTTFVSDPYLYPHRAPNALFVPCMHSTKALLFMYIFKLPNRVSSTIVRCIRGETTHFSAFGIIVKQPAPLLTRLFSSLSSENPTPSNPFSAGGRVVIPAKSCYNLPIVFHGVN